MSSLILPEMAVPASPVRCEDCLHFRSDPAHPLHARLCDRVEGRLLSADYERSLPAPSCGPEGRDFVPRGIAP